MKTLNFTLFVGILLARNARGMDQDMAVTRPLPAEKSSAEHYKILATNFAKGCITGDYDLVRECLDRGAAKLYLSGGN